MRRLLCALLLLAAPVAGQDTIRTRTPVVVAPVADTVVRTEVDTVLRLEVDTVFVSGGEAAVVCLQRESRWFRWSDWEAVECPDDIPVDLPGEDPPTDEPDEPQEPDEPEEPSDDPPAGPVEPTDPGDAWYVQDWTSLNGIENSTQSGSGSISLIAGPTPGTRALRATFVDAGHGETQVGATLPFPRASADRPREVWIEYQVRWSSNWEVNGPYRNGGTCGHKHMFLFDQRQTGASGGRWESYVGLFDAIMSQEISGNVLADRRDYSPSHRSLWNGEWHLMRYHARMHATQGVWDMWVNGQQFRWGVGDTDFGAHYFAYLALSRNMNCGVGRTMTLDFGPVRVYTSDPGW